MPISTAPPASPANCSPRSWRISFLNIVKLNTTENPEIAEEYGITAVPTIHFYKDGKLVDSHVGVMQPQAVKDVIAQYMYA